VTYAFGELDIDAVCSVILPENTRSIAVARRLGFRLGEERVLSNFPSMPHGIWWLTRGEWTAVDAGEQRTPTSPSGGFGHAPSCDVLAADSRSRE
jgi:hypothetical protein